MLPLGTILVVENYLPFRKILCSELQQRSEMPVLYASDGLEAVEKAKELQPDLIFIDIGLPKLNGIQAAKQIRKLAPHANLLFLSQESDSDVVQETFRVGGRAYIHKPLALNHLLPAIHVVRWGGRFVSSDLEFKDADSRHRHEVQFYRNDSGFLTNSARFITEGLRTADATVVLATRSHLVSLGQRLTRGGFDIDHATRQGTYIPLDAADTLAMVTVNGMPDPLLFSASLCALIETISQKTQIERPRVAIFGECVGLLCGQGKADEAVSLEKIGNHLGQTHDVDILCAYPLPQNPERNSTLKSICAEHTAVYWQ